METITFTSVSCYLLQDYRTKGLTALTPGMDCDKTAMGLPPIIYAVFLIVKAFW
jgi:hypothetical protein